MRAPPWSSTPSPSLFIILADSRTHHPRILPKPAFQRLVVEKGGVGAGTVIQVERKVGVKIHPFRMEVSEPEPGCVLAERDIDSGAVTTFTVTPREEGARSHVEIATEWPHKPGFKGLVERLVNPMVVTPLHRKELAQLAEYAKTAKV